ncbi:TSUP family transporter [Shewanella halifaxensis]|uniref:TSUP family transporter n=1 Tax=Shewanella halifaxensis TaxID=271098 RepID=UPI000D59E403|nr:TSUP family transporter [Shewanella halifaxensis]
MQIERQESSIKYLPITLILLVFWFVFVYSNTDGIELVTQYMHYSVLGIVGAIFANSTGAGGGVIFIPAFNSLGFSVEQSLATSFAIQCFGMTTGAISWLHYYKQQQQHNWQQLPLMLTCLIPVSIAGLWTVEALNIRPIDNLEQSFSVFSIILGCALLVNHFKQSGKLTPSPQASFNVNKTELCILATITYLGGMITAWLSVGVGELIVIYLLLKRVEATLAVAVGVIVTAATVWSTAGLHFSASSDTYFSVVAVAAPGAVIGALLAKKLALFLPIKTLKLFFAAWIIFSGAAILIME